jgi:hypothetical protein
MAGCCVKKKLQPEQDDLPQEMLLFVDGFFISNLKHMIKTTNTRLA